MMRKEFGTVSASVVLAAVFVGADANAAPASVEHRRPLWEIGSALGGSSLGLRTGPSASVGLGSGGTTAYALAATVGYSVSPRIELALSPSLARYSAINSVTALEFTAGPIFNFAAGSPDDAAFAWAAPGLALLSAAGSTTTAFRFVIGVGKRFALAPGLSYSPTISFAGTNGDVNSVTLHFAPVRFTILL